MILDGNASMESGKKENASALDGIRKGWNFWASTFFQQGAIIDCTHFFHFWSFFFPSQSWALSRTALLML